MSKETGIDENIASSLKNEVSSPLNGVVVKKRKFACVECRQQKSKCDAVDRAPEPCTKCEKKGVSCILKKDYRRTYKRARNQFIEQRFKELTNSLTTLSTTEILLKIKKEQMELLDNRNFTKEKVEKLKNNELDNGSSELFLASLSASNGMSNNRGNSIGMSKPVIQGRTRYTGMTKEQLRSPPRSLSDIYMNSEDIAELFQEYATKYHPFLPIVNLDMGAERLYNLSPCLFWVILLVGLRRRFNSSDLMTRLSVAVKAVLAEITISPIIKYSPTEEDEPIINVASVYSVQAFLIYSFWPPLTSSLSADTSWNTIGTAMFQAIRVGLNCAEFSKEYDTHSELTNEKLKTWISCNIVSQIVASSFGFPAYASFDYSVINLTRKSEANNFPVEINQMAQMVYFEHQIVSTINSNPGRPDGMVGLSEKQPLLNVLSQRFSQLELKLEEEGVDDIRKFLLLVSKVHLLTYYFTDITNVGTEIDSYKFALLKEPVNFETKRGLVMCYNAALDLLKHANYMWENDATIIKYFPGIFVLNIWQAACIISKLAHSSLSSVLDIANGKDVYQKAVMLTFNASVLKYDMAYRSSGIMRSIWSLYSNMYDSWKSELNEETKLFDFNLGIVVKSRMSVSVFFDCLYVLRSRSGMAKLEREKGMKEEYDEEDEEEIDEKAYTDTYGEVHGTSRKSSKLKMLAFKDPESKARKIMKTIPLDPHPINASSVPTSVSTSGTPNSHSSEGGSALQSLNHVSPVPKETIQPEPRALTTSPYILSSSIDSSKITSIAAGTAQTSNSAPATIDESMAYNISAEQPGPQLSKITTDNKDHNKSHNQLMNQHIGNNTKESPNFVMGNWDNWESDLVWKDVDLLMNEFAFDPSV